MYVDSIHYRTLREVATLMSPMTTVPLSGCLSFQYQQDYAEGHMFSVYSRDRAGQYTELWKADLPESNQVMQEAQTQVWIHLELHRGFHRHGCFNNAQNKLTGNSKIKQSSTCKQQQQQIRRTTVNKLNTKHD